MQLAACSDNYYLSVITDVNEINISSSTKCRCL